MRRAPTLVMMALVLGGCPKESDERKPAPSTRGSASSSSAPAAVAPASAKASASADAGPSEGAGAKPAAAAVAAATYGGNYSVAPAKLYIPEDKQWNSVKQAKDDPSKLVGEGALSLNVESTGRVTGTIDTGPASPAVLEGTVLDSEIHAIVRRKDTSDDGLTGTLVATRTADGVSGKLSLAESNAALVREGSFTLKKK